MGPPQQRSTHNANTKSKEWTCCFGIHVHTATIMIGIWHLFLNILALSLLAVIWRNPHMMEELERSYDYSVDLNAPALPTPLSKVDPPYAYRDHTMSYRRQYQTFDMGGLVCTCMIAITLMMIYGTIKGKPSHLLPFFCLQLFDFAITTLTAAGYLCYLQAIHRIIAESHRLPWREKLLELSPEELVIVVLVVFVFIVFLKAYAIGIVWRCYKYLTLRQQNIRIVLPSIVPYSMPHEVERGNLTGGEDRAYSTLLPNYDEAIAQYMKQAPPPSYQVAMSNYPENDNNDTNGGNNTATAIGIDLNALMNDNNNDSSNNNNTVHINANTVRLPELNDTTNSTTVSTPTATVAGSASMEFEDVENENAAVNVLPPPYNTALNILNARHQQQQQQEEQQQLSTHNNPSTGIDADQGGALNNRNESHA